VCSSAYDTEQKINVAVKKITRPFLSPVHAKRACREIRMLKHMRHENVSSVSFFQLLNVEVHLLSPVPVDLADVDTCVTADRHYVLSAAHCTCSHSCYVNFTLIN